MEDKTILIHPGGAEIPFDPDHAKRLMAEPKNGGWKWKEEPTDESSPDGHDTESTIPDDGQSKDEDNGVGDSTNNSDKGKTKKKK